jgi:hypothetical protein
MSWLRDEIKLISSSEDRNKVIELFEKAVQDYLCKFIVHHISICASNF